MTITTVDIIRHGEPIGGNLIRGQRDDPLSEEGWRQMWEAVAPIGPWHHVYSSTLSRCQAFAKAIAEKQGLPLSVDSRLQEVGFGTWEGRSRDELVREEPENIARFYWDPDTYRPEDAESLTDFCDRVISAWDELVGRHTGQHLLVVAHAGVIRAVVGYLLDIPRKNLYRLRIPHAGMVRVRLEDEEPPTLMFGQWSNLTTRGR
jgi:alpha-ribazole phosphatase